MDQNRCKVPYSNQKQFNKPLNQQIVGVKEHGYGVNLYRVLETVSKGANLTIYCFLSQLEQWKERNNGQYPDEIYLQVDGGSENANQWVLALLELLVVKRVTKRIYFTRLPTGHTHEDIDAVFGVIWNALKSKNCETFEEFEEKVRNGFQRNENVEQLYKNNLNIKTVAIIPDFVSLLSPCIDSKLENLHKEPYTQHQWRFDFVERSPSFPFGCKVRYRAYSSDKVVEFHIRPKGQCRTSIGQRTGLEPVTLHCRWYPTGNCIAGRSVEGMHILQSIIPHYNDESFPCLPPVGITKSSFDTMEETIAEVSRVFDGENDNDTKTKNSWLKWARTYIIPISNNNKQ